MSRHLRPTSGARPASSRSPWLLGRRPWIVPIPGTKRVAYLEENAAAIAVTLSAAELALLDEVVPVTAIAGARYPPERMPSWTSAPRR